jgi:hypothetical protein
MKFKESDINLIIQHDLTDTEMIFLKVAKDELPCTRAELRIECLDYMPYNTWDFIVRQMKKKGYININRSQTTMVYFTEKGQLIADQTGKGPEWKRFNSRNKHHVMPFLVSSGSVKIRRAGNTNFHYSKSL